MGCRPVCYRIYSSTLGLCPLERAAPLLSSCNNSYIPSHGRISPGTESPQWRTTVRPAVISEPLERNTVGISKVGMTLMLILLEDESEKNSNVGDYVLQGTLWESGRQARGPFLGIKLTKLFFSEILAGVSYWIGYTPSGRGQSFTKQRLWRQSGLWFSEIGSAPVSPPNSIFSFPLQIFPKITLALRLHQSPQ